MNGGVRRAALDNLGRLRQGGSSWDVVRDGGCRVSVRVRTGGVCLVLAHVSSSQCFIAADCVKIVQMTGARVAKRRGSLENAGGALSAAPAVHARPGGRGARDPGSTGCEEQTFRVECPRGDPAYGQGSKASCRRRFDWRFRDEPARAHHAEFRRFPALVPQAPDPRAVMRPCER